MYQRLGGISLCVLALALPVQAQSLSEKAHAAYQRKDFAASAQLYLEALKADDRELNTYYNGACALALAGKPNEAFDLLGQLLKQGWADAGQLKQDEDFSSLRADCRAAAARVCTTSATLIPTSANLSASVVNRNSP